MTPFPWIYTLAHQREDEVRATASQESRAATPAPPRWWRLPTLRREVAPQCAPAPIYHSPCAGDQLA